MTIILHSYYNTLVLLQIYAQKGGEYMELKIEENKKHNTIGEAFGVSEKLFDTVEEAMTKYLALRMAKEVMVDHDHDKDGNCLKDKKCVETTKTQKLKAFLESKEFAATKWKLKTANDYFVLGFMFAAATTNARKLIERYALEHAIGGEDGILGALLGGKINGHKIEVTIKR